MLQSIPPLFLYVESLVFNFPSDPPSFIGQRDDIVGGDLAVGYPFEFADGLGPFAIGFGF